MNKYAKIINNQTKQCDVGLGTNTEFYTKLGYTLQDVEQSDIDGQWYLAENCPMKTDEQKEQEEAQRISLLKLTRGDVFRALLLAKGVTREQIKAQLEAMPMSTTEEQITRELALIDFDEALDYYRGNSLIDTVGLGLGITSEQLDKFFDAGNSSDLSIKQNAYKYLTMVNFKIITNPEDAIITINSEEISEKTLIYGTLVNYIISNDGYKTIEDNIELLEDTVLHIELQPENTSTEDNIEEMQE